MQRAPMAALDRMMQFSPMKVYDSIVVIPQDRTVGRSGRNNW